MIWPGPALTPPESLKFSGFIIVNLQCCATGSQLVQKIQGLCPEDLGSTGPFEGLLKIYVLIFAGPGPLVYEYIVCSWENSVLLDSATKYVRTVMKLSQKVSLGTETCEI